MKKEELKSEFRKLVGVGGLSELLLMFMLGRRETSRFKDSLRKGSPDKSVKLVFTPLLQQVDRLFERLWAYRLAAGLFDM